MESSTTTTYDGLQLAGEHHRLERPAGRVVIVHGYAEHKGRYHQLVEVLGATGFECHLVDLRGHGESGGRRGHVRQFSDYRDDLERFLGPAISEHPLPVPTFLLGHSLGGLIALDFVVDRPHDFRGLVVSSPFLAPALRISTTKRFLGTVAAHILPTLPFDSGLDASALTRDEAMMAAHVDDPLVFDTVTPGWFLEVEKAQERVRQRAPDITLPALFLVGDADPVADPTAAQAMYDALGSEDKTLHLYEGFRHEVFNEIGREEVFTDLIAWLQDHRITDR